MTETHVLNDISFPLLFEGVEKKLEVKYKIPQEYTLDGLRDIDARDWSYLLNSFGCQILNTIENETFVLIYSRNLACLFTRTR